MDVPAVDFVTLSDSLSSPIPKPKLKPRNEEQGAARVVCLDSDTESDGSFTHTMVNRVAHKVSNDGVSGGLLDESKKNNDSWLGLHKCLNHSKTWSISHSLSPEKEMQKRGHGTFDALRQSDETWTFGSEALTQDVDRDNYSCSLIDPSDRPKVDHVDWQPCENYSPVASLDRSGNSYSYNTITYSASPGKEARSPSQYLTKAQGVQLPETQGRVCLSTPSKDWGDCSSSAWDDYLKGITNKLETSKAVVQVDVCPKHMSKQEIKQDYCDHYSGNDRNSGEYSILKNKLRKCDAGAGENNSRKRLKKSSNGLSSKADRQGSKTTSIGTFADIDDSLDKEWEKLNKREQQIKDREEREARKQQLKEEQEILRKGKQEEKKRLQELKKRRNEEEKKRKEELKAEAVERRKVEKEKEKWEKGKFALQNMTALVDTQILEGGLIGGHLLTRFAEKGFKYHLVKNPVKKTVVWQMKLPSKESVVDWQEDCFSQDSQEPKSFKTAGPQLSLESVDVSYVLVVLEGNEFLEMITEGTLDKHIRNLQKLYPGSTLCYLINKLMWLLKKREQKQYKTPGDNWSRPPVEQVLAMLVTSYDGVHSRLCVDEAEVSEHIVGLTRSLAECPFKRRLTPLSLSANGDHVVKKDPNNDVIKRDIWLKALVALPKVSGSCAIAIAKKYPSMSALYEAYLDPAKTVHEKEHLLQGLMKEGLLGPEHNRRIGPACSRRVFRILMAEQGNLHTDDVEEGADAFRD